MKVLELFLEYKEYYIIGIRITLILSFLSLIVGAVLGTILSIMKLSKFNLLRLVSSTYIEVIRGTPMMVQISLVYFGSYVAMGADMNAFLAALIAVSLNSAAYVAEIIRSGIQSIDKGQIEAGRSLGLSEWQILRYIILPLAIRNILPALGNEFVTLIKETSVASTIGVADLMYTSKIVQSSSYQPFDPLVIVAVIYFIFTFSLSKFIGIFEKRLAH
jgi:His/Glu/Gln/Arg/opine family amino acid ABC transporter permease subunit